MTATAIETNQMKLEEEKRFTVGRERRICKVAIDFKDDGLPGLRNLDTVAPEFLTATEDTRKWSR